MTMGDRIVVMKDGVIQQVGSPSTIFDRPRNVFVAGFIGTPQMNFFDITFKAAPKEVEIILPNGDSTKFKLSDFTAIQDEYIDGKEKKLTLGVRGEHIVISPKGIAAEVTFVEILGNTTNIMCKLLHSEKEFTITVQERSELKIGDQINIQFLAKNLHLFDPESGETIYQYQEEGDEQ